MLTCSNADDRVLLNSGVMVESNDVRNKFPQYCNKFCCLGEMMGVWDGAEASSVEGVRSRWKKFRELLFVRMIGPSLHLEGRLYTSCVTSVMHYGSEN